jgi:glycosyltransferase involved in cell wall biosynthesis
VELEAVARRAREFDVIHCHVEWTHLPLLNRLQTPFVTTLHGRVDLPGLKGVIDQFPYAPFVSISVDQRKSLPSAHWTGTVHHGFPPDLLRPRFEPGRYLAFLGRLSPEKGPEAAIRIAQAANMNLQIAAKIPRSEWRYFEERLRPMIDGHQIALRGEIGGRQKEQFLCEAAALIFRSIGRSRSGWS